MKKINQRQRVEKFNRVPSNEFPETAYAIFRFKEQSIGVELYASAKLEGFLDGERVGIYKLTGVKTVKVKRSLGR